MNYLMLILLAPFFIVACATDSHSPEKRPISFEDGITQVEVKFDESDKVSVGSKVNALSVQCKTKRFRDSERETCLKARIGEGRVVGINREIATVEFKRDTAISPETEFEVLSGEAK